MRKTTLERQSEWIARRKKELGIEGGNYVARNPGTRRTDSKKALLEKIEQGAKRTGIDWRK